jgi:RsiW-degrading membrane proteinase PrsW (M82 family)
MNRRCFFCGAALRDGAAFCTSCGRRQGVSPAVQHGAPANRTLLAVAGGAAGAAAFSCLAACVALLLIASVPNPIALAVATLAAIVPAIVYSALVLLLDRFESEPWYTLLGAFLWGAVVAIVFSVLLELLSGSFVLVAYGEEAANVFLPVVAAPVFEEMTKGAALLVLLVAFRHELDSMLDGLIYGALVGLGFAMTENILYFGSFLLEGGVPGLIVGFFIRAGLGGFAHALFTASTGVAIGWARSRYGQGSLRFIAPAGGLAVAMLMHAAWNGSAVLADYFEVDAGGALLLLAFLFFGLVVPPFLVALGIAYVSWRRQLGILRTQLAGEVELGTITPEEYVMLANPGPRRSAHWRALMASGPRGWVRQHRFTRLTSQLAFQKHHAAHGEAEPSGFRKRSNDALRLEISAARASLAA